MAVLTQEQFNQAIQNIVGDNQDDNTIAFIENMTDTYNDLVGKATNGGTDWEQRYKDNDAMWRKKYTDRFFGGTGDDDEPPHDEPPKPMTFEDLFKEGE